MPYLLISNNEHYPNSKQCLQSIQSKQLKVSNSLPLSPPPPACSLSSIITERRRSIRLNVKQRAHFVYFAGMNVNQIPAAKRPASRHICQSDTPKDYANSKHCLHSKPSKHLPLY